MEGTHEVGSRPFMPASTLSGRSVALLRVNLDDYTSEGRSISHGNYTRTFFYAHNSRSQSLIEKRLQQIGDALNVTDDLGLIEPLVLTTKCLVGQLRQFNQVIKEFDHKIKELFKSHPDHFLFRESPGGRRTAGSSSSFPVRF
jgi:hypothetical protein